MAEKWVKKGVPAPLFDRLCDYEPTQSTEPTPFIVYDKKQLLDSIQREVENLLNTRCTVPFSEYESYELSALPYGIPDVFGLPDSKYVDGSSKTGRDKLSKLIATSISVFEPRLRNIQVDVNAMDTKTQSLDVIIHGDVVIGDVQEPISFPVSTQHFEELADQESSGYDTTAKFDYPGSS